MDRKIQFYIVQKGKETFDTICYTVKTANGMKMFFVMLRDDEFDHVEFISYKKFQKVYGGKDVVVRPVESLQVEAPENLQQILDYWEIIGSSIFKKAI